MTFTVKVRGGSGLMVAEYTCPVHGRVEATVQRDSRGDPPEEIDCPLPLEPVVQAALSRRGFPAFDCGQRSPFTISAPAVHTQFVVSATQGRSSPKPHPRSMDTRPLAEGQSYTEWRKERRKVWEEERHERVKRMLE